MATSGRTRPPLYDLGRNAGRLADPQRLFDGPVDMPELRI